MCGSPPDAPQLPQYPNLTSAEQTNLGQQASAANQAGSVIQGLSGQLGNNQNILQQISGLFNSDGTVNQNALKQLQQSAAQSTQAAGQQGQAALSGLTGTNNALGETESAYTNALTNGAPVNQQLQFTQNQNFQALKEQAAQQGIQINGDNWANASSNSTAGQKLLQNTQQNNNIQNQQYQFGYINQLAGNAGQLANTASTQANTGTSLGQYAQQTPLNYAQSSVTNGQSALFPFLTNYQNQLMSGYQPLYQQQLGPYQQQMAQQQANYQAGLQQYNAGQSQMMGWANLGLSALGTGAKVASMYQGGGSGALAEGAV